MNILITGISSGLGKELANNFLSDGHRVWGIARKEKNNPIIADLILNKNFNYTKCDLAREKEIVNFINTIKGEGRALDVVILNAAVIQEDFTDSKLSYSKFKEIFNINLFGSISIIDKIMPHFQQQGKGVFIGISSLSTYRAVGDIGRIAYPASKSALNTVFEAFRLQPVNPEIRFVIVNLGRMEEKDGFLTTSYKKASQKIISTLEQNKNVINYPLLPSLVTRMLIFLPDSFVSRLMNKPG